MSPLSNSKAPAQSAGPGSRNSAHPLSDLFSVITDPHISSEARLLYVILTEMAWTKGYCWPSILTQAGYLGRSEDSVCRYHKELAALGLLQVDRDGPRNYYYPRSAPGSGRLARTDTAPPTRTDADLTIKEPTIKYVHNVVPFHPATTGTDDTPNSPIPQNPNVTNVVLPDPSQTSNDNPDSTFIPSPAEIGDKLSHSPCTRITPPPCPPRTSKIFNAYLLTEILETTGDAKSKGCWISVINQVPEDRIRYALSCLKMAMNDGTVLHRPGAYLLTIIMANNPDLSFKAGKYRSKQAHVENLSRPERSPRATAEIPLKPARPDTHRSHDPEQDTSEPLDTAALVKGWKVLYEPGDVSLLLSQVQRCIPDWAVRTTWEALRQEQPTQAEASVLADFLDLAALRFQMANHEPLPLRFQRGNISGEGLFAKSPSPDPSSKTLRNID